MHKMIEILGGVSFLLGACSMDSKNLLYPVLMVTIGLAAILFEVRRYSE